MFVTCKPLFIHPWDMALEPKIFIASCWQRWQMTCPGCRRRSHWGNDYTAHLFWRHGRPDQTMTDGGDRHIHVHGGNTKNKTNLNVVTISVSWYFHFRKKSKIGDFKKKYLVIRRQFIGREMFFLPQVVYLSYQSEGNPPKSIPPFAPSSVKVKAV